MKRHPISALFALFLGSSGLLVAAPPLQPPDGNDQENSGLIVYRASDPGDIMLSWWGYDEHFYFIEHSDDLINWSYFPVYEEGFESAITWGFQIETDRRFWRLKYSDDPASDLLSADFSGTGVSNWTEIQFGLDPFVSVDSDGSGLPDAWQLYYFAQLGVDPHADADGDGFTNLQEFQAGTNPLDYWDRPGGAPNLAPTLTVPSDQILIWPNDTVTLSATASDPDAGPSPLLLSWSVVSGPSGVVLTDPDALQTDAVFPSSGTWLLRFTADDGEATSSATVAVNVVDDPEVLPQVLRFVSPVDGAWVEQGESLLIWLKSDELDDPVIETEISRDGVTILLFEEDPWGTPTTWSDNFTESGFGYVTYEATARHASGLFTTSAITVFSAPPGTPPPGGGGGGGGGGAGPGGPVSGNVVGSIVAAPLPEDGPLGLSETEHSVSTLGRDLIEEEEKLSVAPGQVMLIEVVVNSAEYPIYTEDGSEFNDTVSWSITPSWGSSAVSGSHSVNELHGKFEEGDGTAIVGIFAVTFPFDGDPDAEPYVTLKGSVQNIADGAYDSTVSFRSTKVILVPDYDRDGEIREEEAEINGETRLSDYDRARRREIFHFWRNDDNDDPGSEVDGNDIPGQSGGGDGRESTIQGTRDLVDYFPVFIDLQDFLESVELEDVRIHLVQLGLNFVEPQSVLSQGWTPSEANEYLRNPATSRELANAQKRRASPVNPFSEDFLEEIKAGRGVLLLDARSITSDDLRLVVQYKGSQLFDLRLPIKISSVEQMYRRVNLSSVIQGTAQSTPTATGDPAGWPDAYTTNRYFAFLHGFNVSQQQAREWNSQMFKRLFWSGSQARYVGVTWHGDTAPNYYRGVKNAFLTSEYLAGALDSIPSNEMVIAAHSLGNVVVSEALTSTSSQTLAVDQYFLLSAAVPIEAYDPQQISGTDSSGSMWSNIRYPDWSEYADRVTASYWHELFLDGKPDASGDPVFGDSRQQITWKGRFSILGNAWNFFSTGEDVLRNASGSVPTLFSQFTGKGPDSWTFQEMNKGRGGLHTGVPYVEGLSPTHGGWGFSQEPTYWAGGDFYPPHIINALDDAQLRSEPFFYRFRNSSPNNSFYNGATLRNALGDTSAITMASQPFTQYKLLAEAIPATSFAAGANAIGAFGEAQNIDMQDQHQTSGEWPQERPNQNWEHSDLKDVAFPYVYQLFDQLVEIGNLK
ncbi:MAG: hypothetical protein EA353_10500 [Puniceicoccaceae bacterium]|nr:MAG: hypothetical protein EA353_10500 [Puniceicoccaceae bacterium]